jgi:hypothetical protein
MEAITCCFTWYRREHAAQVAVQRHTAPIPHQGDPRQGTKAASVSTSATGDRMIPVVSSDQDMVLEASKLRCTEFHGVIASSNPL